MSARWLSVLVWLPLAAASACTLAYWPSDDLAGAAADAGSDAPALADAPSTASGDGAASIDGATTTVAPCPPNPLFCDDFEHDDVLGPFATKRGPVAITTGRARSPTRSLSAIARKNQPAPETDITLTLPPRATLSLWFYAPSAPPRPGTNFRIAHLLWGDACDWDLAWTLAVSADEGLGMSPAAYDANRNASCGPVAFDYKRLMTPDDVFVPRWHHLVVTMDVSNMLRTTVATIDDGPPQTSSVNSTRTRVPKSAALAVGVPCINTNSGCFDWDGDDYEVLVDDVSVVATP